MLRTLAVLVLVAAASVLSWYGWMAWDHEYQHDANGVPSGPYQAWQVFGSAVTVIIAVVWGVLNLRGGVRFVVPVVATLGYAVAWSASASEGDDTGLWLVGLGFLLVGAGCGLALLTTLVVVLRDRRSA